MARRSSRGSVYNNRAQAQVNHAVGSSQPSSSPGVRLPVAHAQSAPNPTSNRTPQASSQSKSQSNPWERASQFVQNVGRGSHDTVRSYTTDLYSGAHSMATGKEVEERDYEDESLGAVWGRSIGGVILDGDNLDDAWDETGRRITKEPGRVVGEVATEAAIFAATMGFGAAAKGARIGFGATSKLSKTAKNYKSIRGAYAEDGATGFTRKTGLIRKGTEQKWIGKKKTTTTTTNRKGITKTKTRKTRWTDRIEGRGISTGEKLGNKFGRTTRLGDAMIIGASGLGVGGKAGKGGKVDDTMASNLGSVFNKNLDTPSKLTKDSIDSIGSDDLLKTRSEVLKEKKDTDVTLAKLRSDHDDVPEVSQNFTNPGQHNARAAADAAGEGLNRKSITDPFEFKTGKVTFNAGSETNDIKLLEGNITGGLSNKNQIVIYGANEGEDGAIKNYGQMAAHAVEYMGASREGRRGIVNQSLAFVTKKNPGNETSDYMTLAEIKPNAKEILDTVKANPDREFIFTAAGTGQAQHTAKDMVGLFGSDIVQPNMILSRKYFNELSPVLQTAYHQKRGYTGVRKTISGGDPGVDQTAQMAMYDLGSATGGTVPKGFRSATGSIEKYARKFGLKENDSTDFPTRTRANVQDSDGTIVWFDGETPGRGSKLTIDIAKQNKKPLLINPQGPDDVVAFTNQFGIETLNVAGPRSKNMSEGLKSMVQYTLSGTRVDKRASRISTEGKTAYNLSQYDNFLSEFGGDAPRASKRFFGKTKVTDVNRHRSALAGLVGRSKFLPHGSDNLIAREASAEIPIEQSGKNFVQTAESDVTGFTPISLDISPDFVNMRIKNMLQINRAEGKTPEAGYSMAGELVKTYEMTGFRQQVSQGAETARLARINDTLAKPLMKVVDGVTYKSGGAKQVESYRLGSMLQATGPDPKGKIATIFTDYSSMKYDLKGTVFPPGYKNLSKAEQKAYRAANPKEFKAQKIGGNTSLPDVGKEFDELSLVPRGETASMPGSSGGSKPLLYFKPGAESNLQDYWRWRGNKHTYDAEDKLMYGLTDDVTQMHKSAKQFKKNNSNTEVVQNTVIGTRYIPSYIGRRSSSTTSVINASETMTTAQLSQRPPGLLSTNVSDTPVEFFVGGGPYPKPDDTSTFITKADKTNFGSNTRVLNPSDSTSMDPNKDVLTRPEYQDLYLGIDEEKVTDIAFEKKMRGGITTSLPSWLRLAVMRKQFQPALQKQMPGTTPAEMTSLLQTRRKMTDEKWMKSTGVTKQDILDQEFPAIKPDDTYDKVDLQWLITGKQTPGFNNKPPVSWRAKNFKESEKTMLNQKPMDGKGETVLDIGDTIFRSANVQNLPYRKKVKGALVGEKKRRNPKNPSGTWLSSMVPRSSIIPPAGPRVTKGYKTVPYDSPRPDIYNYSPLGGVGMGKKPGSQLRNIMGGILQEGKTLTAKQRGAAASKERKRVAAANKKERARNKEAEKERKKSGANRPGWEIAPKDKDEVQERMNFKPFNTDVTEIDDGYTISW